MPQRHAILSLELKKLCFLHLTFSVAELGCSRFMMSVHRLNINLNITFDVSAPLACEMYSMTFQNKRESFKVECFNRQ